MTRAILIGITALVLLLTGCGGSSVSLENAAGTQWPGLSAGQKARLAKSCLEKAGRSSSLPRAARRAALATDPRALVTRLDLYYTEEASQLDSLTKACRLIVEQRFAPKVRITGLDPGRVMPAAEQFLRVQGTVTPGASVMINGGERSRAANVLGTLFRGVIEVGPGRHHIYVTASFVDNKVDSTAIVVTRKPSAANVARQAYEEARGKSMARQQRLRKAALEAAQKKKPY